MARTDSDSVKAVLAPGGDYDLLNEPSLTPFITVANLIMNRVMTCASLKGVTISDDEALAMETWLAAHAYQASDQGYTSKSTEGASGSFMGQTGMGIDGTKYGQTALMMDPSGCLAAITRGSSASMMWLGKAPSAQTDYEDRD